MLIAEDLLLLLTDDATGKLAVEASKLDVSLGGAMLVELTMAERVALDDRKRIAVPNPTPTGDAPLDAALNLLEAKQGKKPSSVVGALCKNLRSELYQRLAERGVVRAEKSRVLGLFPARRWPAGDAAHEQEVRRALVACLVDQASVDSRTAALVALLHALRSVHKVVRPAEHGLSRKELNRRAQAVADGDWGSAAVRKAVDDMTAAITAGVMVATTAAIGAGS